MDKIKDFLISIGLGKNETEVYSVLVEMGTSSVLDISKKTHIHRSNIYEALRNLVQRGLVYEINQPTKLFYARSPESLGDYLKHKEIELHEIVREFQSKTIRRNGESKAGISKGIFAVREALKSLLATNETIYVYGIPSHAHEKIGPMVKDFHKERIKQKVEMKHIYNADAVDRAIQTNKMKLTENRVLPHFYNTIASTNIAGNKVVFFIWGDEITVIEIMDQDIADTYKKYFDILWKKAKKV